MENGELKKLKQRIGELEEENEKLRKSGTCAKELSDLRNSFIGVVSHQLRTPLNAVRWNLESLIKGDMGKLTASQEEFLRGAYEAELSVIGRLSDLLTVLDIEEGRALLKRDAVSMESLAQSAVGAWEKKFRKKDIEFEYSAPSESLPTIFADADKIRKVFNHLLHNAFDYTGEKGKVTAKMSKKGEFIRFELADNGIGIPEAEQSRIFKKFYRATNASTMSTDRSGIGLSSCKYYVEQHGGRMGFESIEGKGSTFWFELPII